MHTSVLSYPSGATCSYENDLQRAGNIGLIMLYSTMGHNVSTSHEVGSIFL